MTLTLRALADPEIPAAAAVLADGMRDNPLHVRAFGDDPAPRERALTRLFESVLLRVQTKGLIEGAFQEGRLIGVCGGLAPGNCRVTLGQKLAFLPALKKGNSWTTVFRVLEWAGAWSKRDPDKAHWHLGPVGVQRSEQGKGVGRALMASFCARMDADRADAYLETDKEINVKIYEKFGFKVVAREEIIGVPCWSMSRGQTVY
jgi:ribosomal protein S18 acetylase RimI-like enzyme